MKKILLVLPDYYSTFPPLGLLKLSAYHKSRGDLVKLIHLKTTKKNCLQEIIPYSSLYEVDFYPDEILITSLFTFAWKQVHETIFLCKNKWKKSKIKVGGIYASLMSDRIKQLGVEVVKGLVPKVENTMPDYSLIPKWKTSILFSTRGCIRSCDFCAVKKIEPKFQAKKSIKHLIHPDHEDIILWDNNFLGYKGYADIIDELVEINKPVDFNQGLDIRLMNDKKIADLKKLKFGAPLRIAYDNISFRDKFLKNIKRVKEARIASSIHAYVLFNFNDHPDELIIRLHDLLDNGIYPFLMRFEPLDTLKKGQYVGKNWNRNQLRAVREMLNRWGIQGGLKPYGKYGRKLKDYFKKHKHSSFDKCIKDGSITIN